MAAADDEPVGFESCPIRASLGTLGRRWSLLILRDIAFGPSKSRKEILGRNPGLSGRVLTRRLAELQSEGLVERSLTRPGKLGVRYRLTEKGRDVVPVLAGLLRYGMLHHADRVFADHRPRTIDQVFPGADPGPLEKLREFGR